MQSEKVVYLLRHHITDENKQGRFLGRSNSGIINLGERKNKIKADFDRLNLQFNNIYSSPSNRCLQTADSFLELNSTSRVKVSPALKELDFGEFEGTHVKSCSEIYKFYSSPDQCIPGGESIKDFFSRVQEFMDSLENQSLIITHGGVINAFLMLALKSRLGLFPLFEIDNFSLSKITFNGEKAFINFVNRPIEK